MIADFCAVGGKIVEARVPAAEHDRLRAVRPAAAAAEPGGRLLLGRRRHRHAAVLKAFEQAYGKLDPKKCIGNLFFAFLGADKVVAPKFVGAYVGGFGHGPGPEDAAGEARTRRVMRRSTTRS